MLDAIKHRGRDDVGTYVDDHVGLGSDRLAIVDVAGGHQPASNETGSIRVVLNGEIYNYRELRALLQQYGHRFNCLSDTEVIAHAYEEWGEKTFQKLQGMFALAVWDKDKHIMLVARDRVGIKPIYYAQAGATFAFASEAKAILSARLIDTPTVNDVAIAQLLQVGYLLAPMSMLNEVKQLCPASYLTYAEGHFSVNKYWEPPLYDEKVPSVETIREVLRNSVVRQTETSDVEVSAFLSGGLDTSTVVAFASGARSERLQTFCMGFGEHTDEFSDAKLVAEAFATDHHELLIDASDAMHVFPRMIWHSEMPKVNLYSWFVDEAASRFGKVCLSGLGGDELFCGYPTSSRFQRARQFSRIHKLPLAKTLATVAGAVPTERGRYAEALTSETLAYSTIITGFPPSDIHPAIPYHVRPYFSGSGDFVQKVVDCEFHTKLPYDYLLIEDAMSMAHTLEVRVPLLDDLLLQLMLGVPSKYQMTMSSGKLLLRSAMKGILPERCFAKPKWGFSIDVYSWWRSAVREYAERYLPESKIVKQLAGPWHQKVLQKIRLPTSPSRTRWYTMAWMMLGLDLWHRIFIDENGTEPGFSW
jgi:asparagine synthase (glutamine-hydrolysing)